MHEFLVGGRRDQGLESDVVPLRLDGETLGDLLADIDVGTHRLGVLVQELQRGTGQVRAVDDLPGLGDIRRRCALPLCSTSAALSTTTAATAAGSAIGMTERIRKCLLWRSIRAS